MILQKMLAWYIANRQTWYYENGQKIFEATFKDGDLISEKCWDEDGNERVCN